MFQKNRSFVVGREKQTNIAGGDASEALRLMRNFEESGQGWFWATDSMGDLTYLSHGILQPLNEQYETVLGAPFSGFFRHADDDASGRNTLPFKLAKRAAFEKLIVHAGLYDDERCWSVFGRPQYDGAGGFTGYRGSAVDVTEQRRSSRDASQLAKYDSLTGLPNRLRMSEVLDAQLRTSEHHGRPCAVVLIDLDRFKQVNDTLGHPAGDALLKQVGDRLLIVVGDREKVFRLGGDEFQVILQNCADRGVIGKLASDIIASLSQPYWVDGSRCVIGASVGIAVGPVDGWTREELMRNADLALYASKSNGRGRFRFFSGDLLQAAEDKRRLEEDLRDALAKGEIDLEYQPVVNAVTNCMSGVEALIRWNHPVHGAISPAQFIPVAEDMDLIGPLGEWALRKACSDAAKWPGNLRVAVNVSPLQFMEGSLPAIVVSALAASGLAPDRLELEITEGVFLEDASETDTMFSTLKEIGVRLALDDFGTGYSSLGYLRTAPFDKIKIDQTFVRAATLPGSRNGAIIAAIVALANALNMETTAEGIEFMDQLELVRSLGVSHVQGWVYSKSLTCEELSRRLDAGDCVLAPSGPAKQRSDRQAMYRKVGIIHGNRYESVLIRNLSDSGALIEGLSGVSAGTLTVVDFGDGQFAFARVIRAGARQQGIAFEQLLVDDGNGGLCTQRRIAPYLLSTIGLPSPNDPEKSADEPQNLAALEELAKKLGVSLTSKAALQDKPELEKLAPAFRELSRHHLDTLSGDQQGLEGARRDLNDHILPRFGHLRLDQVSKIDVQTWLASKTELAGVPPGTDGRLHSVLRQMWTLAVRLRLPGAEPNPLQDDAPSGKDDRRGESLHPAHVERLIEAVGASHNRHLKFIVSLLILTGARQGELLKAEWADIDIDAKTWRIPTAEADKSREVQLSSATIELLLGLPRWDGCPYVIANPSTKKPYRSFLNSWEAARLKAGLPYIEIDDLRYCDPSALPSSETLLEPVRSCRHAATPR